jgi:hypothetical protein
LEEELLIAREKSLLKRQKQHGKNASNAVGKNGELILVSAPLVKSV